MRPPRYYGQRTHSEIPICITLDNFTPFILPLKPVMFIFPLLICYVMIEEQLFLEVQLWYIC